MLRRDGAFNGESTGSVRWVRRGVCIAEVLYLADSEQLTLGYTYRRVGSTSEDVVLPIKLRWSDCHFGGKRPWFICPGAGCGKRVALLYGARKFLCRHCLELAYPVQRESEVERAARRTEYLRHRLGWATGVLTSDGGRPKGMHFRTFVRLRAKQEYHRQRAMQGMAECMNLFPR